MSVKPKTVVSPLSAVKKSMLRDFNTIIQALLAMSMSLINSNCQCEACIILRSNIAPIQRLISAGKQIKKIEAV